jgi:hypothetical protein
MTSPTDTQIDFELWISYYVGTVPFFKAGTQFYPSTQDGFVAALTAAETSQCSLETVDFRKDSQLQTIMSPSTVHLCSQALSSIKENKRAVAVEKHKQACMCVGCPTKHYAQYTTSTGDYEVDQLSAQSRATLDNCIQAILKY